jgi:hypothetical protein
MWDEDACYENACQDVDADLEVNNESAWINKTIRQYFYWC